MTFEINTVVSWTSQAQGSETTKTGTIIAIVPPKQICINVLKTLDPAKYSFQKEPGMSRPTESYLVGVGPSSGAGKIKVYWPLVNKLKRVDRSIEFTQIATTIYNELNPQTRPALDIIE